MIRKIASYLAKRGMSLLNRLTYASVGGEARPVFFDIDELRPELRRIDEHFDEIRAELEGVLPETDRMPRYHEADGSQEEISNADELFWKVFFVYIHKEERWLEGAKRCPKTAELVSKVPGVLNAFFSILEPGKSVPAHEGPSYHYLRYHLGMVVPEHAPPKIRVKDEFHTWQVGKSVVFDDSWEHEVINESDSVRVVLILDFMRPLPPHLALLNWAVRGLAGLSVSREGHEEIGKALGYQGNPAA